MTGIYEHPLTTLAGDEASLAEHRGKVLLIVNTASACGFTPQYEGLQQLWEELGPRGLVVLGFPCNQFGAQEPGTAEEIGAFCSANYGVTFPMFAKVDVNGDEAHPLFRQLKREARGVFGTERIKWNFTKFLVDRTGEVVDRFAPTTAPKKIRKRIEALL